MPPPRVNTAARDWDWQFRNSSLSSWAVQSASPALWAKVPRSGSRCRRQLGQLIPDVFFQRRQPVLLGHTIGGCPVFRKVLRSRLSQQALPLSNVLPDLTRQRPIFHLLPEIFHSRQACL